MRDFFILLRSNIIESTNRAHRHRSKICSARKSRHGDGRSFTTQLLNEINDCGAQKWWIQRKAAENRKLYRTARVREDRQYLLRAAIAEWMNGGGTVDELMPQKHEEVSAQHSSDAIDNLATDTAFTLHMRDVSSESAIETALSIMLCSHTDLYRSFEEIAIDATEDSESEKRTSLTASQTRSVSDDDQTASQIPVGVRMELVGANGDSFESSSVEEPAMMRS